MYIVRGDDHLCHILYHACSWPLYSYVWRLFVVICIVVSLYYADWVAGLLLGSSSLDFWDGLIMYSSHRMTPLTSYIRGHLLQLIFPHQVNHTCMAFPYPSTDSQDPMDLFYTFYVYKIIPKNMLKLPYTTFNPFLAYIRGFDL